MRKTIATIFALAALGLAGSSALAASTRNVSIKDFFFSPKSLTISKGTKVHWRWAGVTPHNVKVTSGPVKFHSRIQIHGTYNFTFNRRGTYHIVCTVHGFGMTIKVR